jgi:hypothetical protein
MPLTFERFRSLAAGLQGAVESSHMGHPDFRIGGRIFATLGYPNADFGMVKLSPEQQDAFCASEPVVYAAASGSWGRAGATTIKLREANEESVLRALKIALETVGQKTKPPGAAPRKKAQGRGRTSGA